MKSILFSLRYIMAYICAMLIQAQIWVYSFRMPWYITLAVAHMLCGLLSPVMYLIKEFLGAGGFFHGFFVRHPKLGYGLIPVVVPMWLFNWARDLVTSCEMVVFAPEKTG